MKSYQDEVIQKYLIFLKLFKQATNATFDILPCAWRACLRRNKKNENALCLDLSNRVSCVGSKSDVGCSQVAYEDRSFWALSKEIWDEDKKELKLGLGCLQLGIIQPNIQSRKSCNDNNSSHLNFSASNYTPPCIDVTTRDVLIKR